MYVKWSKATLRRKHFFANIVKKINQPKLHLPKRLVKRHAINSVTTSQYFSVIPEDD